MNWFDLELWEPYCSSVSVAWKCVVIIVVLETAKVG